MPEFDEEFRRLFALYFQPVFSFFLRRGFPREECRDLTQETFLRVYRSIGRFRGEANVQPPIDPVLLALSLGATFVARGFSGDKAQLVPIIKAGLRHNGFALIDVISPCVSFNDHESSTKSYRYTRDHFHDAASVDFVPLRREITAPIDDGVVVVDMHDGSTVRFRKVAADYDPRDRDAAYAYVREHQAKGEVVTGLLHIDERAPDMHAVSGTIERPLVDLPFDEICPGSAALAELMEEYR